MASVQPDLAASEKVGSDAAADAFVFNDPDFNPTNPNKKREEFRNYNDSRRQGIVRQHYTEMRKNQTVQFVQRMHHKWLSFDRERMSIWDAFRCLESYVDSSDPDTNLPNLEHMLQTAEAIRADGHPDWFQLVGLIHDLGKIMFRWGTAEDGSMGTADGPQWSLGGDTFPVGCALSDQLVMPELNQLNPDMANPDLNTACGRYQPGCGLDALDLCWGHDEYMYRMLTHNGCTLPPQGLWMIRYHSFYAWHTGGGYQHLLCDADDEKLFWVLEFNKYDLYTKSDKRPDAAHLAHYYQTLIEKYIPGDLWW